MSPPRALREAGCQVLAVAPADSHVQRLLDAGLAFAPIPLSGAGTNPFTELRSVAALSQVLRRHHADLVLSYTPKGNLYAALACIFAGRAFVPNVSGLGRSFIRRNWVTPVVTLMYRATFGRALRVFFQNQDDLDAFVRARLVPLALSERLPGSGVDLRHFAPQPPSTNAADAPLFLLVARMLWDKGVGEFVEAARQVRRTCPGAHFMLLGFTDVANPSAIPHQQLTAWAAEGVVTVCPPVDDVRPWLAQADCVVLPSYREGVPRTLLEAAACARPVITTDAPGCRDTVVHGQTGFLCRVRDADDLAARMLEFIALPAEQRQQMGLAGRAFVVAHFDERVVIDRYLAVASAVAASR